MPTPTRPNHRRTLLIGAIVTGLSILFVFSPFLLGKGVISNAIVAFSLVGFCIGGSVLLHGSYDWWRSR